MAEERVQRRIAAILAADVAEYARLVGADEEDTLQRLKAHRRELIEPQIAEHSGRIVKTTGDGLLVEFASPVEAVRCAIELQKGMAHRNADVRPERRIEFRIGINLGDVVVDENDLHGDGVNVAARLESISETGSILISGAVYEQVRDRLPFEFGDLGKKQLKNIARPVRVYRLGKEARLRVAAPSPALPDKPSIAVLPFENMSGDPEQNYFADGIAEDIITDLSRLGRLFVIARNSSFTYRNRVVDAKTIGQELGVRYILEGSVRKVANRVRITGQLIDTTTGTHLWAQRFDGELENVFALQDEVTAKIVEELLGRLTMPPARARPKNMDAYELCVRVRSLVELSSQDSREGMLMVQRAVTLDPDYAEAHALLAHCHWMAWVHWGQPMVPHRELAMTTAKKAIALDPNDACCRWILGNILACERQWKESEKEFATALDLDPNNADTWACLSDMSVLAGQADRGLEQIRSAFRFNPYPPNWYFCLLGQAQYAARDYAAAVETLRREETYRTSSRRFLAASLAQLGQLDEAQREAELYLVNNPYFTISHWVSSQPIRDEATRDHFVEGFRKASLPD